MGPNSLPCAKVAKGRIVRDARTASKRARIHRLGALLRAETHGGGRLWACPGARGNLRLPRPALLRALLFRAEGRERQDRGGDLEGRPRQDALQAAGRPVSYTHLRAHETDSYLVCR